MVDHLERWLSTSLDRLHYVAVDIETTGLHFQEGHRICEIGAVLYGPSGLLGSFQALINPERDVPAEAQRIHQIPPERLREAPPFHLVAPLIVRFVDTYPILAYNANFDLGFINYELTQSGMTPLANPVVDVLEVARRLDIMPPGGKYSLDRVARQLQLNYRPERGHRALYDAQMTALVFRQLEPRLVRQGVQTLRDLLRWLNANVVLMMEMVQVFTHAQLNRQWIRIRYQKMDRTVVERTVLPLQIERRNQEYFLTAYDLHRRDRRTFRICQIRSWHILSEAPDVSETSQDTHVPSRCGEENTIHRADE